VNCCSALPTQTRPSIHFVEVETEGEPVALEHSEVGWFTAAELEGLPLAPADAQFVRTLEGAAG